MGIEKNSVWKIKKIPEISDDDYMKTVEKAPSAAAQPAPETAAKGKKEAGEEKEKVNIPDYKKKKDQMNVELEGLIEKVKEANRMKDNKAKEKAQEEMRKVSGQIYKLTDEATEKNEGKLPEGWWGK